MNVAEAAGTLQERLKDLGGNKFTESILRNLLQTGERDVASKIHPAYLAELEVKESNVVAVAGVTAFSSLANTVMEGNNGILTVNIAGGGRYCKRMDPQYAKENESYYRQGSVLDPYFKTEERTIVVLPTSVTSIDVRYLKLPPPLYYNFVITGASSTTSFVGNASQGLNEANTDYYKNAVIHCIEKNSYHVVTAYTYTTRTFTVSPAAGANFTTGQTFRFITHGFDSLTLSGVNFALGEILHPAIIANAEYQALAQTEKVQERDAAYVRWTDTLKMLNAKYTEPERLGLQSLQQKR